MKKNNLSAARTEFEKILKTDKNIAEAHYGLGLVFVQTESKKDEAIKCFKKAIEINNSFEKAWNKLIKLYLDWQHPSQILIKITEETEKDSNFIPYCEKYVLDSLSNIPLSTSHMNLLRAKILFEIGKDESGLDFYWSALENVQNPADANLFYKDLLYLMQNKELKQLKETFISELKTFYTNFWLRRDPNLYTEINERIPEHYRRLTTALRFYQRTEHSIENYISINRRFHPIRRYSALKNVMGDSLLTLVGFPKEILENRIFDDAGLIYIRHGEPDDKAIASELSLTFSDLSPKIQMMFTSDDYEYNLQQINSWYFGSDQTPMSLSWKYRASHSHPEMIFHFVKYGDKPGWIIEAIPSTYTNREFWDPTYRELKEAVVSARFSDIILTKMDELGDVMEEVFTPLGQVEMSNIYMEMSTKIPKLVNTVRERNIEHIEYAFTTETSDFAYDDQPLEFRYSFASFKGEEGKNFLEIYYTLEGKNTTLAYDGDLTKLVIDQSFSFFEEDGDQVQRLQKVNNIDIGLSPEAWKDRGVLGLETLNLKPGVYQYEIHFRDLEANKLGVYQGKLENNNYWSNDLQISDVLLVSNLHAAKNVEKFKKKDIAYTPRMFSNFHKNESVGLYFEIYNLSLDESQKSNFKINYQLRPAESNGTVNKILGLFSKDKDRITLENSYSGDSNSEVIHISFELDNRPAGDYEILIEVEDLNGNKKVEETINIKIV